MAKVSRLEPLFDLAIIDKYGERFGKLPREILQERTDDVLPFLFLWKEQDEYRQRYQRAEKDLKPTE
jgi:hypothetical protein